MEWKSPPEQVVLGLGLGLNLDGLGRVSRRGAKRAASMSKKKKAPVVVVVVVVFGCVERVGSAGEQEWRQEAVNTA